jgi:hypothetical protein
LGYRWLVASVTLAGMLALGCESEGVSTDERPDEGAGPAEVHMPGLLEEQLGEVRLGKRVTIELNGGPVNDETIKALRGVAGIEKVVIQRSELTVAGLEVLATLPQLKQLVIRGRPIDDEGLVPLVSIKSLRVLNLPSTTVSLDSFRTLQKLPHLMLLRMGSPRLSDDCLEVVAGLPSLRFLHLIDVPISDHGLRHLFECEQLESLYLDGARVSGQGVDALMENLPALHLHLDQHHHDRDPHGHDHPAGASRGRPAGGAVYCWRAADGQSWHC